MDEHLKVSLDELEEGSLFKYNNTIALKTEYRTEKGAVKSYIVGSGEMFWGGTSCPEDLNGLMVLPLTLR
ncbi:hypothetical protein V7128_01955 [Neobacillus vireti]|uniref:hypothetical protein n=1 Tax=Neobacillus vireti TaxID=220686 RepID=UPI002FFF176C